MVTASCNPTNPIQFSLASPLQPRRRVQTCCVLHYHSFPTPWKRFNFPAKNGLRIRKVSGIRRGFSRGESTVVCKVSTIDQSEFEDVVLKSEVPVLVDFVAEWCGPCKLVAPAVDWASQEYEGRLKVVKIDHDSNPQLIEQYKVYGLPTLIIFKNGQEVPGSRREGAITKIKLKEYLDSLLVSITVT
ncbi:hypothetical protein AMTRI_Chr09g12580 [Amborella trichopoda]